MNKTLENLESVTAFCFVNSMKS